MVWVEFEQEWWSCHMEEMEICTEILRKADDDQAISLLGVISFAVCH